MVFACFYWRYPLVNSHSYGKSPFLMGKSTINGQFSTAILVYQRVHFKTILLVASNHSVVGGWGPGSPKAQPLPPNSKGIQFPTFNASWSMIWGVILPFKTYSYHILTIFTIYNHILPYITIKLPYIIPYITILLPENYHINSHILPQKYHIYIYYHKNTIYIPIYITIYIYSHIYYHIYYHVFPYITFFFLEESA